MIAADNIMKEFREGVTSSMYDYFVKDKPQFMKVSPGLLSQFWSCPCSSWHDKGGEESVECVDIQYDTRVFRHHNHQHLY